MERLNIEVKREGEWGRNRKRFMTVNCLRYVTSGWITIRVKKRKKKKEEKSKENARDARRCYSSTTDKEEDS